LIINSLLVDWILAGFRDAYVLVVGAPVPEVKEPTLVNVMVLEPVVDVPCK
jgi:hypothetical protein